MPTFTILIALLLQTTAPRDFDPGQWLKDVSYIISRREKSDFQQLKTQEDRQKFVDHFWRRRDPDPSTEHSQFRAEYYRRIEHANQHFAFGRPGWRTDRGRVYIIHGEPDERLEFSSRIIRSLILSGPTSPTSRSGGSSYSDGRRIYPP